MNDKIGIINNLSFNNTNIKSRELIKQELVIALRIMDSLNNDYGISGHITVKDTELSNHFWINPFGVKFKDVTVDDLLLINEKGDVIIGNGFPNFAALCIHGPFHWYSNSVNCIVHSHTFYSTALGITNNYLKPTTIESCEFYNDQEIYDEYTGVATSENVGKLLLENFNKNKKNIILLKHHGILITGLSIKQAIWKLISFEKCCKFQLYLDSICSSYDLIDLKDIEKTKIELNTLKANEFQIKPTWSQYEK